MKHTITNRIIVGKSIGFVVGGLVFFLLPMFGVFLEIKFGLGLWLLYILLGVLTAFFGIMDHHPILKFKMPFGFRGAVAGLSMHLLLVLLAYNQVAALMTDFFTAKYGLLSPWWILIDGMILGILMEWAETKFAGEGNIPLK